MYTYTEISHDASLIWEIFFFILCQWKSKSKLSVKKQKQKQKTKQKPVMEAWQDHLGNGGASVQA
ncbi:hypothetical protein ACQP3J_32515 [Escherichia coli]